jgi:hypothetical protein
MTFHIGIAISPILDDMAVMDDESHHPIDPTLADIGINETVDPAKPDIVKGSVGRSGRLDHLAESGKSWDEKDTGKDHRGKLPHADYFIER